MKDDSMGFIAIFRPMDILNIFPSVICYIKLYRKLFSCMRPANDFRYFFVLEKNYEVSLVIQYVHAFGGERLESLNPGDFSWTSLFDSLHVHYEV